MKQSIPFGKYVLGTNNACKRSDVCTVLGSSVFPTIFLVEENHSNNNACGDVNQCKYIPQFWLLFLLDFVYYRMFQH